MTDPHDLRTIQAWLRERKHTTDTWMAEVCGDAADDIERLTRDVAAAETLADGYIEQIARMRLTDEEREAVEYFANFQWTMLKPYTATLRSLLERLA